jgi:hypothetical protein
MVKNSEDIFGVLVRIVRLTADVSFVATIFESFEKSIFV